MQSSHSQVPLEKASWCALRALTQAFQVFFLQQKQLPSCAMFSWKECRTRNVNWHAAWGWHDQLHDSFWGFPKGVCARGVNRNSWGGARTGCNNQFYVFLCGTSLLNPIETQTFSQGFGAKLIIATSARTTPIIEIFPPSQNPPFGNPWSLFNRFKRCPKKLRYGTANLERSWSNSPTLSSGGEDHGAFDPWREGLRNLPLATQLLLN